MKTGLVLEGGALRGLFTAGVLDVLMENGVTFDGMIGVSAGAAFGCNFKSRQAGRVIRYNETYAKDWRYCSMKSFLKTGNLFGAEFAYHTIADELDPFDNDAFERNPMEFHLVATEVQTGRGVYREISRGGANLYEWLRASSAMPVLSQVVEIDGYSLLDGGIADSVPLRYFQGLGYERSLVVLTQPSSYHKTPLKTQWLIERRFSKYPALCKALAHRHEKYNRQILYVAEQESKGNVIVIQPEGVLPISHVTHNKAKMRETYLLGRREAEKSLEKIKALSRQSS